MTRGVIVSATALGFSPRFDGAGFSISTNFQNMAQTVTAGPFTFMSRAQLDVIRIAFAGDTPEYTRGLAGASVNGQSFTFTHGGVEYHREEFAALLQDAYVQLGETKYGCPPGNRTAARFGNGGSADGYGLGNTY